MRKLVFAALIAASATLPFGATGASAQAGCKEFGNTAAAEAQEFGGLGEQVRANVPANDDVALFKSVLCE